MKFKVPQIDMDRFNRNMEEVNNSAACKNIRQACENIQNMKVTVPVIDMKQFNKNMDSMLEETKKTAEKMRRETASSLQKAGFNPGF